MYGSYSGIFGVRIQTKCQKVSVLVSDPRHLETIIIRTSLFGTEGKNPTFGVTRIPIDTLQLWTPIRLQKLKIGENIQFKAGKILYRNI